MTPRVLACLVPLILALPVVVSAAPRIPALERLADRYEQQLQTRRPALYQQLRDSQDPVVIRLNADANQELILISERGVPKYFSTDNIDAAESISTDLVHPGGGFGFTLTGSGTVAGQLAVWDGGLIRTSHQEFQGRATQMDGAGSYTNHGTHVSCTIAGGGIDASALGMSYAAQIHTYDWSSDTSEMATAAAAGLLISNHSYGYTTGWRSSNGDWYWYGDTTVSSGEDHGFGFYNGTAAQYDQIAYDAPNYLIFRSAGNDRGSGPSTGSTHFYWDGGGWASSNAIREVDGGTDGYDCINWDKVAKNVMTVAAVEDVAGGYSGAGSVTMTSFSNWGPCDDGRIKPDISANGRGLYSATANSNSSYSTYSGTSMASPNAAGSANLVTEHWSATHAGTARAATLKAILIHTADECGTANGPDYRFGWGLMNTLGAAMLVSDDALAPAGTKQVWESSLAEGTTDSYYFEVASAGPVRFTLGWTDPPGTPPAAALNPTDLMLVNDLDLRITDGSTTYSPWVLDPTSPATAATTGDNFRDNLEQVWVSSLPVGSYTIDITHKSSLTGGPQDYSLVADTPVTDQSPAVAVPVLAQQTGPPAPVSFPNPFVNETTIAFRVPQVAPVEIAIYDVLGRRVRTLDDGTVRAAGTHRVAWDGRSDYGEPLPAGVYFSRVTIEGRSASNKIVRVNVR